MTTKIDLDKQMEFQFSDQPEESFSGIPQVATKEKKYSFSIGEQSTDIDDKPKKKRQYNKNKKVDKKVKAIIIDHNEYKAIKAKLLELYKLKISKLGEEEFIHEIIESLHAHKWIMLEWTFKAKKYYVRLPEEKYDDKNRYGAIFMARRSEILHKRMEILANEITRRFVDGEG